MPLDKRSERIEKLMGDYFKSTHIDRNKFDELITTHRDKSFYWQIYEAMKIVYQLELEGKEWNSASFTQNTFKGFHVKGSLSEQGLMEIIISSSIKALELIFELDRPENLASVSNTFGSHISHVIKRQYLDTKFEGRTQANKSITEYKEKMMSELFVIAVNNHELVRYFLKKEPSYLDRLKSYLLENDLKKLQNKYSDLFGPEDFTPKKK